MTDIDREKLRELCEQATPGPWRWWTSCSWRRLSSDARGKDRDGRSLDRDGGVICPHVCRDGHPDLIVSEEDADFIAAARTALPALLDLTDAQAAKIAELEAENARLSANLDAETAAVEGEIHVRELAYELIRDCAAALGNGAFVSPECSDEFHAQVPIEIAECVSALRKRIASLESERDQLRKQVEEPSIALTRAEVQSGLDRVRWAELLILQLPDNHDGRNSWLLNYGRGNESAQIRERNSAKRTARELSAASAPEQKEQG